MPYAIDRATLRVALETRWATVLDARQADLYDAAHLPGALNIPVEWAVRRAAELLPDRDAMIATYSADVTCRRGEWLAAVLEELGYSDLRVYLGGLQDWVRAGLPVVTVRESRAPSLRAQH